MTESFSNLVSAAYLGAAVLFILSLGGLSSQETARKGNVYGMIGMGLAMVAALASTSVGTSSPSYGPMIAAVVVGGVFGAFVAVRVAMTAMPQMVAALHSFVGLAAVLVGVSTYLDPLHGATGDVVSLLEIYVDVAFGAVTFTGSIVAWGKLQGTISGTPVLLPGRHILNALVLVAILVIALPFVWTVAEEGASSVSGLYWLLVMAALASILGIHGVLAIGGADMPVVVSLLNSYSGWTAAAAGFMLSNDLLIVTGALVGSSGAILSYIMCEAMNRSIWSVVLGGFGTGAQPRPSAVSTPQSEVDVQAIDIDTLAALLREAKDVVVVPGYGMAVAQAQHLVKDFSTLISGRGARLRFAIHPVAGRLPGHMNVLLAEAGVPYDIVLEMDEINDDLSSVDVVLVIGANDIVNPGAMEDEASPIYGMPVLRVWEAGTAVVLKRGMATGYAGVGNPLFFRSNTRMLFGDAKDSMASLASALHDG